MILNDVSGLPQGYLPRPGDRFRCPSPVPQYDMQWIEILEELEPDPFQYLPQFRWAYLRMRTEDGEELTAFFRQPPDGIELHPGTLMAHGLRRPRAPVRRRAGSASAAAGRRPGT